jgi:hypothetical protein
MYCDSKGRWLFLPSPSLITCFVTINVAACGLSSEVPFDKSDDKAEDEDEKEDVFASSRALDFLSCFASDIGDEGKDDDNDVFALLLLLSLDFAYEFTFTKIDKANTEEIIKKRNLNANLAVTFGKNISPFLLDYKHSMNYFYFSSSFFLFYILEFEMMKVSQQLASSIVSLLN